MKTAESLESDLKNLMEDFKSEERKTEELKEFKTERLKEYIKREQEYREIIEGLNKKLRPKELYNGGDERINLEEIRRFHKNILEKIALVQMRTSKVLLDQEKDIIHFYNEKIN